MTQFEESSFVYYSHRSDSVFGVEEAKPMSPTRATQALIRDFRMRGGNYMPPLMRKQMLLEIELAVQSLLRGEIAAIEVCNLGGPEVRTLCVYGDMDEAKKKGIGKAIRIDPEKSYSESLCRLADVRSRASYAWNLAHAKQVGVKDEL